MVGDRVTFTPFDPNKKSNWLFVDIYGSFFTMLAIGFIELAVAFLLFGITGIDLLEVVRGGYHLVAAKTHNVVAWWSMFALLLGVPTFLIVFVGRYNFTVVGQQRTFRYICRWL